MLSTGKDMSDEGNAAPRPDVKLLQFGERCLYDAKRFPHLRAAATLGVGEMLLARWWSNQQTRLSWGICGSLRLAARMLNSKLSFAGKSTFSQQHALQS